MLNCVLVTHHIMAPYKLVRNDHIMSHVWGLCVYVLVWLVRHSTWWSTYQDVSSRTHCYQVLTMKNVDRSIGPCVKYLSRSTVLTSVLLVYRTLASLVSKSLYHGWSKIHSVEVIWDSRTLASLLNLCRVLSGVSVTCLCVWRMWLVSGEYLKRNLARWSEQFEASKTNEMPVMDRLMSWLRQHLPDDDGTSLIHGDYR